MTIKEIETRLAEIEVEMETEGADLDALTEEVRSLKEAKEKEIEERKKVVEEVKTIVPDATRTFKEEEKKEERIMGVESVEYRNAWLKKLQNKELTEVEERAYATTDTYNAIPTIVAEKMFGKMKKIAPMINEITLLKVAGNVKFATQNVDNPATKHTENASMSPSADTIVSVTLGGTEFMKIIQISKSVATMSVDAFENWLVSYLAVDIARAIDDFILNDSNNGIGAGTYTTGTNQILNTATSGYTYKNIIDMIALLPASYDAEAKIVTNKKTLYGQIANITNSAGQPIFVESPEAGMSGRIMGYPVIVDDYVTTTNNAVYLGAWENVVGNLAEDIKVEASAEAGFSTGSIMYRGFAIFDSKVANAEAIVRLVSTTN